LWLDLPTIQSLSNNVTSNGTVNGNDAATGNLLSNTALLRDNGIYYGFDSTNANSCLSTTPYK
jgi:hypothetical protein